MEDPLYDERALNSEFSICFDYRRFAARLSARLGTPKQRLHRL